MENINSIGENAFWGCKSLKDVTFCRSGNVSIGCSAFQNCGLTQVEIPDTVNQIGSQAFSNNYITDSRSLLNNVYKYKDLEEYKLYQKDHIQKILKYSMEAFKKREDLVRVVKKISNFIKI